MDGIRNANRQIRTWVVRVLHAKANTQVLRGCSDTRREWMKGEVGVKKDYDEC